MSKKPSLLFQHYSRIPGSTYYSQNYAGIICLSLTVTVSDGIAATPVSFFPTEEGSDVVKRLTGR